MQSEAKDNQQDSTKEIVFARSLAGCGPRIIPTSVGHLHPGTPSHCSGCGGREKV